MFMRRKRKIAARMLALAFAARATIAVAMLDCFHVTDTQSDEENAVRATKAAIAANHVLDEPQNPEYTSGPDLQSVYDEGTNWLKLHPLFAELVVQSLRVRSIAWFALNKQAAVFGESILLEFGHLFPDAPSPSSYEALIMRVIAALPEDKRIRVRRLIAEHSQERTA